MKKASSAEAGFRGDYISPAVVHYGSWYLKDHKQRLRVACDKTVLKKIRDHQESSIPIVLEDYLTDGKYRMRGGQAIGIVNFYPPGRPVEINDVTPFNFFGGNFDRYLTSVLADPKAGKVNGFANWEGRNLVSATFSGPSVSESYYFDPNQGYLPLVEIAEADSLRTHNHITKVKHFPDNRWFPEKWVFIQHLRGAKEEFRVRTLEVTSLNVSSPPPDSAFDFDLSEYFQVLDPDRASSVYHPSPGERVRVAEMHKVAERLDAQVAARGRPGVSPSPRLSRPYWLIALLGVLLVIVGLAVLWWRRGKNTTRNETGASGR